MSVAGVYVVFGCGTAYVGESNDILDRPTVQSAHLLGWPWTIVKYMANGTSGAAKRRRLRAEAAVAQGYAALGLQLVSMTMPEVTLLANAGARKSEALRRASRSRLITSWSKKTTEERNAYMQWLNDQLTHDQRVAAGKKGAKARWHPQHLPKPEH